MHVLVRLGAVVASCLMQYEALGATGLDPDRIKVALTDTLTDSGLAISPSGGTQACVCIPSVAAAAPTALIA